MCLFYISNEDIIERLQWNEYKEGKTEFVGSSQGNQCITHGYTSGAACLKASVE